ncbi:MAG: hypothetical protein HQL54_06745 [Magnetococcales bacterium]|nr:hypothetical protein [Magnetococcales bacterium]
MIIRIAIFLFILFLIVSYILHRRGIKVGLSPTGKSVLFNVLVQAVRLLLRRIGL